MCKLHNIVCSVGKCFVSAPVDQIERWDSSSAYDRAQKLYMVRLKKEASLLSLIYCKTDDETVDCKLFL